MQKSNTSHDAPSDTECKRETSVRSLLKDFTQETSMHGLGRVASSRYLWLRLLWALLVLAGACVAIYNVTGIILTYSIYPVATVVTLEYASQIDFPAVTICNLNMIRKSQFQSNSHLSDLSEGDNAQVTESPNDYFDPVAKRQEDELIQSHMAGLDKDIRKDVGHQIADMILFCTFQGKTCGRDDFTNFYDSKFGNCFTFNKGEGPKRVTRSGPYYGLELLLNVEQEEYMSLTSTLGFKVVVHPKRQMPFPEDEGVIVSPGFNTHTAVTKLEMKRTEAPYGKCVNYNKEEEARLNMYSTTYDVGYSDKACRRSCFQTAVHGDCGCCHRDYPCLITGANGQELDIPFCNYSVPSTANCVNFITSMFESDQLGCSAKCLRACGETSFTTDVYTGRWPTKSTEDLFVAFLQTHSFATGKTIDVDYVRENIAKLNVYFKELNYERIETSPAYDWSRLLSDLGGQFGLWLGFSLLTAVELLQLIFAICQHLGQRFLRRSRRTSPQSSAAEMR